MKKTPEKKAEEISVQEVTRRTAGGTFIYNIYKQKVTRRAAKRGRPHYDIIASININPHEKLVTKQIATNSQLGRILLG